MASDDRIVSIHPTTHGFGFTVFESTTLVDWGNVHIRPADNDKALERIIELLSWYDPAIVVIEDTDWKGSRRRKRVRALLSEVTRLVRGSSVRLSRISKFDIRASFRTSEKPTKHDIARTITIHYPELEAQLPPPRKIWMSEDERMAIFDSAALALTFIHGPSGSLNDDIE